MLNKTILKSLIFCGVIFLVCGNFSTNAASQIRQGRYVEQMNSSLMYAIIKTANKGKKIFNEELLENKQSCGACHIKQNFPKIIGKHVNNRTIAAIQHCYYAYIGNRNAAIPEETLNYILVYLLATGRSTEKN